MKKLNIFRINITNIFYKITIVNHTDSVKVVCVIEYVNPLTGNRQIIKGVSKKHPDDKHDISFAKKLAESRAKQNLYDWYTKQIDKVLRNVIRKHIRLKVREISHIDSLIAEHNDYDLH